MRPLFTEKHYLWFVNLYIAFICVATLGNGMRLPHIGRSWIISDWLINYQGGFVRRGLPGECIYQLSRLTHLKPEFFVVVICLSLYAIIFLSVRRLALGAPRSLWLVALLISPAMLSFQILDTRAGFRKELILLAALALLLAVSRRRQIAAAPTAVYLSVVLVVAVFAHEPLICYAPYFFAALVLGGRSLLQTARICVVPFVLAFVSALVCARHLGTGATAARICASLGYPYVPIAPAGVQANQVCTEGAIGYLRYSPRLALGTVRFDLAHDHYLSFYALMLVLAMWPLVLGSMALRRAGCAWQMAVLWLTAGVSFLGSLVLFVFAEDWGRWIAIHVLAISMLLLFAAANARPRLEAQWSRKPVSPPRRLAAALLLVLYATCWTLPHYNVAVPHFGYLSLVRDMNGHRRNQPHPPEAPLPPLQ